MRNRFVLSILLVTALIILAQVTPIPVAYAVATIVVNTDLDADPPDADGLCSVREAIINANDNAATFADCVAGEDDEDVVFLDLPNGTEITLVSNLPDPTESVAIEGREYVVQIDLEFGTDGIDVANGVTLTLRNIYIDGDDDNGDPIPDNTIEVDSGGILILERVELSKGDGSIGGTIYNQGEISGEFVQIFNGFSDDEGGAIYNDDGGIINLSICGIFNNQANDEGGAIFNEGTLYLHECELSFNFSSTDGGAIFNQGTAEITDSYFDDNDALGYGGALAHVPNATTTLDQVVFNSNAADFGGGVAVPPAPVTLTAGRAPIPNTLQINQGYFTNNTATLDGSNVYSSGSSVVIAHSFFDMTTGSSVASYGGVTSIYNTSFYINDTAVLAAGSGLVQVTHSSFYENSVGIRTIDNVDLTLTDSIFQDQSAACNFTSSTPPAIQGTNLSDDATCGFGTGDNTANLGINVEFSDGGGFGPTLTIIASSPAVDAATGVSPLDVVDLDNDSNRIEDAPFDGRGDGFVRLSGAARDSGAFESNTNPINFVVDRGDDGYAGACTAADNDCTLRGAIVRANAIGGTDTISFDDSLDNIEFDPLNAFGYYQNVSSFAVESEIIFDGPSSRELVIEQDKLDSAYYPLLDAFEHSIFAIGTARGITLSEDRSGMPVTSARGMSKPAAGFAEPSDFNIVFRNLTIEGGVDFEGGAIDFIAIDPGAATLTGTRDPLPETTISLLLQEMTFRNNVAVSGGAVNTLAINAPVMVRSSTFEGNTALATLDCGCSLTNKRDSDEKPAAGFSLPSFVVPGSGGAIAHYGTELQIFDSTFTNNRTGDFGTGGAIYATYIDFGIRMSSMTDARVPDIGTPGVIVFNSTFHENRSYGGGTVPIFLRDPVVSGLGGAIYSEADLYVTQSTFAYNDADMGSSIYLISDSFLPLEGRAPFSESGFANTIFIDETPSDNCYVDSDVSLDINTILSDDESCDGIATEWFDIALDPFGLQDNGGPTQTIGLFEFSIAIDGGDTDVLFNSIDLFDLDSDGDFDEFYPFDQRGVGFDRIVGCNVDIGAFESPLGQPCGSDIQGTILTDDAAFLADPMPNSIQVTEGATIGDMFCFVIDPEPVGAFDVSVISTDPAFLIVDPANPTAPAAEFVVSLDPDTIDTTVCNPGQVFGVHAPFLTTDSADPDLYSAALQIVDVDDLLIDDEDVYVYDPGIVVPALVPGLIPEGGRGSYTVSLSGPPGIQTNALAGHETIRVDLRGYNINLMRPDVTSVTFTRTNWNVDQTINFTAVDDGTDRGVTYFQAIRHQSVSNVVAPFDSRYGGATPNIPSILARMRIADNDLVAGEPLSEAQYDALLLAAWLDLAPTNSVTLEGGAGIALHIRLNGQPIDGEAVVIDLSSMPGVTVAPAQLTFTASNWDIYQPITIYPQFDEANSGLYTLPLQVVVNGSATSAPEFLGAANVVSLHVADDPALIPPAVLVPEQPSASFAPVPEVTTDTGEGTTTE
jgi:hypothetical protein